ncbi:MAG: hypothetical protein ACLFR0_00800 [Alphaproteobacteria bacterium]
MHNFAIGALAATLVIDMMLGFPIAHYSIFGQHLTAFSSSIIVPPLDNLALVMGFEPISASAAAGGTSASTAFQATTIMSGEAGFEACVASGGLTHFHGTELACHP